MVQVISTFIFMLITFIIFNMFSNSFNVTNAPIIKPKKYKVLVKTFVDEKGNVKLHYYPMEFIKFIGWVNLWDVMHFEYETEYTQLCYENLNDAVDILKRRQKYLGIEKEILIVGELPKD